MLENQQRQSKYNIPPILQIATTPSKKELSKIQSLSNKISPCLVLDACKLFSLVSSPANVIDSMTPLICSSVYRENGKLIGSKVFSSTIVESWSSFVKEIYGFRNTNPSTSVFKTLALIEETAILSKTDLSWSELEIGFFKAALHCNIQFHETTPLFSDPFQIPVLLYTLIANSRGSLYPNFSKVCDENTCGELMLLAFKMFLTSYFRHVESCDFEYVINFSYQPNKNEFPLSEFVECCLFVVYAFKNNLDIVSNVLSNTITIFERAKENITDEIQQFYCSSLITCYEAFLDIIGPTTTSQQCQIWETKIKQLKEEWSNDYHSSLLEFSE